MSSRWTSMGRRRRFFTATGIASTIVIFSLVAIIT
jgi:hypothetical protein